MFVLPRHVVAKRVPKTIAPRASARNAVVRSVVREMSGFAPYEKRLVEIIKLGRDRRALRFAKRRLGTHKRALAKREQIVNMLRTHE